MMAAPPLPSTVKAGVRTTNVTQFGLRQWRHGARLLNRAFPLGFREDLVDTTLGAAAGYQAVVPELRRDGEVMDRLSS